MSMATSVGWAKRGCFFLLVYCALFAQTQVSLTRQSKGADFTAFPSTKPAKMGSSLPSTCGIGELFFSTSAVPGQNLNACYAPNQWTLVGGMAAALPTQTGGPAILVSNGSAASWGNLPTGGSGALDCTPGVCDVVTSLVPLKSNANTWNGVNKFSQLQVNVYTVATLPACNTNFEGQMEAIGDGLSPTYLAPVSGNGRVHVPVYCDGTNWVAH